MAFNRTDTRQRAYNKIDVCSPHGNWVDERTYNRSRKGCLVGNWQEEETLRTALGGDEPAVYKVEPTGPRTVRAKGGFSSSKFLVNPNGEGTAGEAHFVSTTRADYNEASADFKQFRPEPFARRRRKDVDEIIQTAVDNAPAAVTIPPSYSTSYKESVSNATSTFAPLGTVQGAVNGTSKSFGMTTTGAYEAPDGPVDSFDYTGDLQVTLYTGNPKSGNKLLVPGVTPATGKSTFARNSNFSTPIDRHPIGGKHRTPQF